jgi:hypothetical protein
MRGKRCDTAFLTFTVLFVLPDINIYFYLFIDKLYVNPVRFHFNLRTNSENDQTNQARNSAFSVVEQPFSSSILQSLTMNWRLPEFLKTDLRQLVHPYYLVNLVLCLSFVVAKLTHPLCDYLFAPGPVSHLINCCPLLCGGQAHPPSRQPPFRSGPSESFYQLLYSPLWWPSSPTPSATTFLLRAR